MSCIDVTLPPWPKVSRVIYVVAAALFDSDGRVLLAQRPEGKSMAGLWEFPGGKLNENEIPEEALIRELKEELGISTGRACLYPLGFASHTYPEFHLLMPLFGCRNWEGTPHGREGQALAWVRPQDLGKYKMPEADIPLLRFVQEAG